jgi:hypothetical protein
MFSLILFKNFSIISTPGSTDSDPYFEYSFGSGSNNVHMSITHMYSLSTDPSGSATGEITEKGQCQDSGDYYLKSKISLDSPLKHVKLQLAHY